MILEFSCCELFRFSKYVDSAIVFPKLLMRNFKKRCVLSNSLTKILPPITALKQDDKGVQVDLQDLGYETSGKSEQDREECSSTGRCLEDRLCMSVC